MICVALLGLTITKLTICIDPGHPSEVGRGTESKKITEIHAAWKVAQYLRENLIKNGYNVVLTKSKEGQFVKNRDRSAIANKAKASLMIRLHCDSQDGEGFAVYIPTRQGTAQGKTGPSKSVLGACKKIGTPFHKTLSLELKGQLKDNGLLSDLKTGVGGKFGALIGSIFSEVPVVLVEMCRLSNPKDVDFIASEAGQKKMALALALATKASLKVPVEKD
jgi:N-acetylmuramoyl-L-alanine amidase